MSAQSIIAALEATYDIDYACTTTDGEVHTITEYRDIIGCLVVSPRRGSIGVGYVHDDAEDDVQPYDITWFSSDDLHSIEVHIDCL
ncbi:hypothetical protein PVA8_364 [Vibrio phage PVA8]|nr:hypothetical protein [Vibrio phage PC-Liy1]URQ03350.1 hypothetical protein PVA8_364 [Vibrio phage PVA8]WBM59083.1 hypothetical protein vBValMPVA8_361 [Vibrio phage vB_ValM_PVA8]